MKCDWCNRPIRKKRETVGNTNLHPECLEEITELTEPMFQEKLHGPTRSEQDKKRSSRVNRNA
jgi:hypothetical protein